MALASPPALTPWLLILAPGVAPGAQEPSSGAAAAPPVEDAADAGESGLVLAGWQLEGSVDLLFRSRRQATRDQNDADLLLSGLLSGALADGDGAEQARFLLDGLLTSDLDGFSGPRGAFSGLQEAWNDRLHGYLYSAWVESDQVLDGAALRLGRQEVLREDALWFDGLRAGYRPAAEWSLSAYGGVPVHFSESQRAGDALAGAGAEWAAAPGVRLGADEIYLRDEQEWLAGGRREVARSNLTLLSGSWRAAPSALLRGTASWIGDRSRRQTLGASWSDPQTEWRGQVQLRHQNDYGEVVATELSPLAAVLGDVAPYWHGLAEVYRRFGSDVEVGVGAARRFLEEESDEGAYNREYRRYFASLHVERFLGPELDAGVRGDVWDPGAGALTAFGGFVGWDYAGSGRVEVGTDFALYRFDLFAGREYIEDRQYYVRAEQAVVDGLKVRARYARDTSQYGTDHLIEVGLALDF